MFVEVIQRTARALDKHGVAYMLIGGQAVMLYGEPRLTRDIDVTVGLEPDEVDGLLRVVEELGWRVLVEDAHDFVGTTYVLPVEATEGVRVDFIFCSSAYEKEALKRARELKIGDVDVRFVSPEDLVIHKIVAGRPRDMEDAKSVLAGCRNLDITYIRRWLDRFEVDLERPLPRMFERLLQTSKEQDSNMEET